MPRACGVHALLSGSSPSIPFQRALDETVIGGVPTTIGYHKLILATDDFIKGEVDTGFIASHAEGVEDCRDLEMVQGGGAVGRGYPIEHLWGQWASI